MVVGDLEERGLQYDNITAHSERCSFHAASRTHYFSLGASRKMTSVMELLVAPLKVFAGLGLSPFQAFVVIGMLTSGAIMNWTYNFNNHDDDGDDDHHE